MRVFCPVNALAGDTSVLDMTVPTFDLPAGARVWGVPASATKGLAGDEAEEREFEAMCECILSLAHTHRSEWSHLLKSEAITVPLRAYLITQNSAAEVADDPYAPDVLWFDASEASAVREFLEA